MGQTATLSLHNVDITRGGRTLISDLTLNLSGPKLLWVAGGNGIGKTSLLRTCAGLSRPTHGDVKWTIANKAVAAPEVISFLPTDSYAKSGLRTAEDAKFWSADLSSVNMSACEHIATDKLSTGQAKRLSFAKTLSADKPIWILDEPLAGLDASGRELIASYLQRHVRAGGLALVASHAPIQVGDIPTQRLTLE